MSVNIITVEDLIRFREELVEEIKSIINSKDKLSTWLRSSEVREMLKISHGKLQQLRASGALPFSKVGGTHFYLRHDIEEMMRKNRTNWDL